MVINTPVLFSGIDLPGFFQEMYVIPQGLLIARKRLQITVFNEFLLKDIVNG